MSSSSGEGEARAAQGLFSRPDFIGCTPNVDLGEGGGQLPRGFYQGSAVAYATGDCSGRGLSTGSAGPFSGVRDDSVTVYSTSYRTSPRKRCFPGPPFPGPPRSRIAKRGRASRSTLASACIPCQAVSPRSKKPRPRKASTLASSLLSCPAWTATVAAVGRPLRCRCLLGLGIGIGVGVGVGVG